MPFDANGNYVIGSDDIPMVPGPKGAALQGKKSKFQSFLSGMQPQGGQGGGLAGGLSTLAGTGGVGGAIGNAMKFLI